MGQETAALKPAQPAQPRYTYTIPEKRRSSADPKNITLVALTLSQEMHANKLVEQTGNAYEKVKMAIVAVDGRPVNWATDEAEEMLNRISPVVREFILKAYMDIHVPTDDETADFLASRKIEV